MQLNRNILLQSLLILIFNIGFSTVTFASEKKENLFSIQDLKISEEEKWMFDTLVNRKDQKLVSLALVSSNKKLQSEQNYYVKILTDFINGLKREGIEEKKKEKVVKIIYEKVHEHFFKKYDINASFEDAFMNGNYNCVTATIMYSIVLQSFNIDYEIKESVSHVFLIALPGAKSISLETTNPQTGYLSITIVINSNL